MIGTNYELKTDSDNNKIQFKYDGANYKNLVVPFDKNEIEITIDTEQKLKKFDKLFYKIVGAEDVIVKEKPEVYIEA